MNNLRVRFAVLAVLAVTSLAACSDSVTCPTGVVDPNDGVPVLTIGPVFNKATGERIDAFTVHDIKFNCAALSSGASVTCATTCGFGTEPGSYSFVVSAPAVGDATFTIDADYTASSLSGQGSNGCYTRLVRHGTELAISL
jgi:hypothetical protein